MDDDDPRPMVRVCCWCEPSDPAVPVYVGWTWAAARARRVQLLTEPWDTGPVESPAVAEDRTASDLVGFVPIEILGPTVAAVHAVLQALGVHDPAEELGEME